MPKNLQFLLHLVRPYLGKMLLAAVIGSCTILCNMGLLGASAVLISAAALMPPILDLLPLIVGVRFFGISRAVFRYSERLVTHDITFRILSKLRSWYYEAILPLTPANLGIYSTGRLFKNILADIEVLKFFYLRVLATPLVALLILLISAVFLGQFSPSAVWVLVAGFALCGLILPLLVRAYSKRNLTGKGEQIERFNVLLHDYLHGQADLKVYAAQAGFFQRLLAQKEQVQQQEYRLARLDNGLLVICGLIANLALWLTLVLAIPQVTSGALSGIYLAMVFLVVWAAFEAVQPLPLAVAYYDESMEALTDLLRLTDGEPQGREGATQVKELPHRCSVEFEKVSFSYNQLRTPALSEVSLSIPAGARVALVGASGAGKSSMANLLLGFYRQGAGKIRLGGIDLDDLGGADLRRLVGVLNQKPYLFAATIRENLLLAKADAAEQELQEVLARAGLSDFIAGLPQGLETQLGEGGTKLSGGQRQRLALARLFLQDPRVIIIDEALQGLDTLTAAHIEQAVLDWSGERTLIAITHNLAYLDDFETIFVLRAGKLLASGDKESLLQECSYFRALYDLEQQRL